MVKILSSKKLKLSDEQTKDKLVDAAIPLFAKYGYEGTKVRDIVKNASVNLCLISYHFSGKEQLYKECLLRFGRERSQAAKKILHPAQDMAEFKVRFKMILEEMFDGFTLNSDLSKIMMREIDSDFPISRDIFEEQILPIKLMFQEFLRDAQKKKIIRSDLSAELMSMSLHSIIMSAVRWEHIMKRYDKKSVFDKKVKEEFMQFITTLFFDGILAETRGAK